MFANLLFTGLIEFTFSLEFNNFLSEKLFESVKISLNIKTYT